MSGHTGRTFPPEHRARIAAAKRGERNQNWQGDNIGYRGAHNRVARALAGQPCAHADDTCHGRMEIALRHDTPSEFVKLDPAGCYSPRVEHYLRLCHSHHVRYDTKGATR